MKTHLAYENAMSLETVRCLTMELRSKSQLPAPTKVIPQALG